MNKIRKLFLGVLLGTLVVVCICGCGKNTVEYITSEENSQKEHLQSSDPEAEEGGNTAGNDTEKQATICIYVCGEVHSPGVYVLLEGSRVCDAFDAAGGLTEAAAKDYWNQARLLSDGEMLYVPTEEEAEERTQESSSNGNAEEDNNKININTATKEDLMTLPGIGAAKAESIIAYRNEHGGFSDIEEIMEVDGIKEGMYKKIKDYLVIN